MKKNIVMDRTPTIFMDELNKEKEDIFNVLCSYNRGENLLIDDEIRNAISFYLELKLTIIKSGLKAGGKKKPVIGIRNLIRALEMP